MWVQFIARKRLASGHNIGQSYTIDFLASQFTESDSAISKENRSLNGNIERIMTRDDLTYDITVTKILSANVELWREFLASATDGQIISFDNDYLSTFAAQVNPQNCKLISRNHSITNTNTAAERFRTTFKVILI